MVSTELEALRQRLLLDLTAVNRPKQRTAAPWQWGRKDAVLLLLLGALVIGFHIPLAFSNTIVTDYDLYVYFYPYWEYRTEALRAAQLPLWNPFMYTGVPFLANIQTGVFYPLNALLVFLEAPRAVTFSYLFHLWLAAAGMYLLLRQLGMGAASGLMGAIVLAFGGFFAAQAGHINQVQTAAWLPFLALTYSSAYRHASLVWAGLAGIILALQITAGHPQETFLSLCIVAMFACYLTVLSAFHAEHASSGWPHHQLQPARRMPLRLLGWSGYAGALLGIVVALGAGLSAVQLLPSLELSELSLRAGGLDYADATSFSLPPSEIMRALLPPFTDPPFSEYTAFIGVFALGLTWAAIRYGSRQPATAFFAVVFVTGLFLALGRFNPLYETLYQHVPGFDLFRVPARWLFLSTFGAAGLAAVGLDSLSALYAQTRQARQIARDVIGTLGLAGLLVAGLIALKHYLVLPGYPTLFWWEVSAAATLLLILAGPLVLPRALLASAFLLLVTAELWFGRAPFPISHPVPSQAYSAVPPGLAQELQDKGLFRTLSIANPAYEPGDLTETRTLLSTHLPPREIEAFIESIKYNEILAPNTGTRFGVASLDGYDGGMLPTKELGELKNLVLSEGKTSERVKLSDSALDLAAILRDHLQGIPPSDFLGQLNVKYIIADRLADTWANGVYLDLDVMRHLNPAEHMTLPLSLGNGVNGLSFATFLEGGADIPQGMVVATVTLDAADGKRRTFPLRVGIETAESRESARAAGRHEKPATAASRRKLDGYNAYIARWDLGEAVFPRSIHIDAQQQLGRFTIAGISLIDTRTGSSQTVDLNPSLRRVLTGDVKVYQNLAVRDRAYFATDVVPRESVDDQLAALPSLKSGQVAMAPSEATPTVESPSRKSDSSSDGGSVRITRYAPEEVVVEVSALQPGYLVLMDTYYPGWRAWRDQNEIGVLRANGVFRAVAVPQGTHTIAFRYEPASLQKGGLVSLVSASVVGGMVIVWPVVSWFRRRPKPHVER